MTHVRRDELVDYVTWEEDLRPAQRPDILAAKELRRVVIGPLTFLFENPDTIRQEMMAEQEAGGTRAPPNRAMRRQAAKRKKKAAGGSKGFAR